MSIVFQVFSVKVIAGTLLLYCVDANKEHNIKIKKQSCGTNHQTRIFADSNI